MTIKELIEAARKHMPTIDITQYTCYDCGAWKDCEWAFDAYNTNGDCLAEK